MSTNDVPGANPEDIKALPPSTRHECRCNSCGQFISKEKYNLGINFCDASHLEKFMSKKGVVAKQKELVPIKVKEAQHISISASR